MGIIPYNFKKRSEVITKVFYRYGSMCKVNNNLSRSSLFSTSRLVSLNHLLAPHMEFFTLLVHNIFMIPRRILMDTLYHDYDSVGDGDISQGPETLKANASILNGEEKQLANILITCGQNHLFKDWAKPGNNTDINSDYSVIFCMDMVDMEIMFEVL